MPTQLGGGIRSIDTIKKMLQTGIERVILGTVAVENPDLVREACRKFGDSIIIGIDTREGLVATRGWKLDTGLKSIEFAQSMAELGAKRLLIAGIESHICIEQTALDALSLGYEVHVISDAISSRTPENLKIGIKKMRRFGAVISSTEMAMYEIMERADTEEFKEVLKLVK